MGILFYCPDCDRPLNVGDQFAGKPGLCPNCKNSVVVPTESEIVKAEFSTRLKSWHRQQESSDSAEAVVFERADATELATSTMQRASGSSSVEKPVETSAPVVTLKPIDVGGVAEVKTESEKVGIGLATRFSAGAPDVLDESGNAVWYVRPPSGGQFGPASPGLLRQWINEGRVTGDSWVWCEGWDNWQPAGEVFPAVASKVSVESISAANSDQVTAAKTRAAYIKARKRRTMRNLVGLIAGTIIVIALIIVLLFVVNGQAA